MKIFSSVAAVVVASAFFSGAANATVEDTQDQANAVANCQGALPSFEGQLRKRPLGVINEGTSDAYVTCAFNTLRDQNDSTLGNTIVNFYGGFFINGNSTDKTVNCTGVVGYENGTPDSTLIYVTKSVTVKANRAAPDPQFGYIFFDPSDSNLAPGTYYQLVQMSCQLPAGVGINDTYVGFRMDDNTSAPAP
ncbi:MAG: hypothetical protein ABIO59_13075 [Luteimonas sp.]